MQDNRRPSRRWAHRAALGVSFAMAAGTAAAQGVGPTFEHFAYGLAGVVLGAGALFVGIRQRSRGPAETIEQEEKNSAQGRHLTAIMEAVPCGIVGLRADGKVAMANTRARHFLGQAETTGSYDWPESVGFLDLDAETPLTGSGSPLERALSGQNLREQPAIMRRGSDPKPRHVTLSSVSLPQAEGQDISTVLAIEDVSEHEEHRQQYDRSSRLDALGQLTGGIAHDFNNLLATIEYGIQLADKESRADKRCIYHSAALASVRRGASLTQRLLTFAKKQPGLARAHMVDDIFQDFAQLAGATIEENIQLTFTNEAPDISIFCDLGQFENALLNLVINSRDAILRSNVGSAVSILARRAEVYPGEHMAEMNGRSDYAEIIVRDDGPGMSEKVRERATDPFFTTKDSNSGSGLGLSMVYGFVQQSNGAMRIVSEPGGGTSVRILLPMGNPATETEENDQIMPEPSGDGQVILIVEDEAALLEMMEQVVTALGYQVLPANSGDEALEIARYEDFDLLLTDVVMPKIGGFQLARDIRALKPGIPVIYMSGYTGFSDAEMGSVVAPLIRKPCAPATLADALKDTLRLPANVA